MIPFLLEVEADGKKKSKKIDYFYFLIFNPLVDKWGIWVIFLDCIFSMCEFVSASSHPSSFPCSFIASEPLSINHQQTIIPDQTILISLVFFRLDGLEMRFLLLVFCGLNYAFFVVSSDYCPLSSKISSWVCSHRAEKIYAFFFRSRQELAL